MPMEPLRSRISCALGYSGGGAGPAGWRDCAEDLSMATIRTGRNVPTIPVTDSDGCRLGLAGRLYAGWLRGRAWVARPACRGDDHGLLRAIRNGLVSSLTFDRRPFWQLASVPAPCPVRAKAPRRR